MKPILFNTEMVKALLEGRKIVTRRIITPQPGPDEELFYIYAGSRKSDIGKWQSRIPGRKWNPPYHAEDILYVRETWAFDTGDADDEIGTGYFAYRADDLHHPDCKWRPSIHMPKEAARIFLRVKCVRVNRLQDITADECAMEGVGLFSGLVCKREEYYKTAFAKLWDSTIKPADMDTYGWDANPWVWVIEFEKISKEEALKC